MVPRQGSTTLKRFVIFGAGTAGVGIADQLYDALCQTGLSEKEARACFWLIDIVQIYPMYLNIETNALT